MLCHWSVVERRSTTIKLHARAPHMHAQHVVNTSVPYLAALHNNTRVGRSHLRPHLHCIYGQQDVHLAFLADFTACLVSTMPSAVHRPPKKTKPPPSDHSSDGVQRKLCFTPTYRYPTPCRSGKKAAAVIEEAMQVIL